MLTEFSKSELFSCLPWCTWSTNAKSPIVNSVGQEFVRKNSKIQKIWEAFACGNHDSWSRLSNLLLNTWDFTITCLTFPSRILPLLPLRTLTPYFIQKTMQNLSEGKSSNFNFDEAGRQGELTEDASRKRSTRWTYSSGLRQTARAKEHHLTNLLKWKASCQFYLHELFCAVVSTTYFFIMVKNKTSQWGLPKRTEKKGGFRSWWSMRYKVYHA